MSSLPLKKLFFKCCSAIPYSLLNNKNLNTFFVPIYHAVADEKLLHMDNIMPYGSKTTKHFEIDLDGLLKFLKPVSFDDLLACVKTGRQLPRNSFIVTFDDGLRHAYENAVPLLYKKGVPAVFFINTSVVDNVALLFRYKASLIIEALKNHPTKIEKANTVFQKHNINPANFRQATLSIRFKQRNILDELATAIEISFDEYLKKEKPYMTTAQLQDMANKGFALGGHSVHHPEYWNLTIDEAVDETVDSCLWIKDKFNLNYTTLSFPFTDRQIPNSFFSALKQKQPIDILFGSQKLQLDEQPNVVQRYDGDNNMSSMPTMLKSLMMFQNLKNLRGQSRFYRPA